MSTEPPSANLACDLLIIGSGAAGLTAAITAASRGLDVIVIEKSDYVGGATAWSGGWVWLPIVNALSHGDDSLKASNYLLQILGPASEKAKIDAFLGQASNLENPLQTQTPVRFQKDVSIPDYHSNIYGYAETGRSRVVAPMNGRALGRDLHRLRKPLQVLTIAGLMPSAGRELQHFYNATRSLTSSLYVLRRFLGHLTNWVQARRNLTLTNGNALAGGLFKAALDLNVTVLTGTCAQSLITKDDRVSGAITKTAANCAQIVATQGVVLACGGFSSDVSGRKRFYNHSQSGQDHWTVAPSDCNGDGMRLGEAVGASVVDLDEAAGAWVPVSLVPQTNGTLVPYPHFADRAKPGLIAVRQNGKRFTNEAAPYFHVMKALFDATAKGEEPAAWLICDHKFQRRYGLGFSKPSPFPIKRHVSSGYLKRAATLYALSKQCGIETKSLASTISTYNAHATSGDDPLYGRGTEPINRAQGDPSVLPNPCVSPLLKPPFYAVKVHPGCLGSFAGLRTDEKARVLDGNHQPIPGLFSCGSDASSIMAGHYPAGGISLGPALVFGYIAGQTATPLESQETTTPKGEGVQHAHI